MVSGAETTGAQNIADAWQRRAQSAEDDLRVAASAPALFTAEWVEKRRAEYVEALAEAGYWRAVSA